MSCDTFFYNNIVFPAQAEYYVSLSVSTDILG